MVLSLAKNSKAGCLFRPNFLKQVVIEIQKMEHPSQKFSKYPPGVVLPRFRPPDYFQDLCAHISGWSQSHLIMT